MAWVLAVDFGTVVTAAAVVDVGVGGGVRPVAVEVDQTWRVPSGVLRLGDGQLVVGRLALNQAALRIEAFEATPKRRMGEAVLDLGGPVRVVDAIAAVLRVMVAEACRMKGGSRPEVVCLTHPATWAATRLAALREAAALAGMPEVVLLPEPVAAACWYAAMSGVVPAGGRVAVYDLGGGTFDAAVVESNGDGSFVTVGRPLGVDPLGGVDFDHALLGLVGQTIERRDRPLWESLRRPVDARWRRRRRALLEQVCLLKEDLSTISQSTLLVPETELEVTVTREQLAGLVRPAVERSAGVLLEAVEAAHMRPDQLAAVYLVGGSSRIPVVEQVIAERLGRSPSTLDEPKQVVAFGAALDTARRTPAHAAPPPPPHQPPPPLHQPPAHQPPPPPHRPPVPPPPGPRPGPEPLVDPRPPRTGRLVAVTSAAVVAIAGAIVAAVVATSHDSSTPSSSGTTSDSPRPCPSGETRDSTGSCVPPSDTAGSSPPSGLSAAERQLVDRLPTSLVDTASCASYSDGEDSNVPAVVSCTPVAAATSSDARVQPPSVIYASQATDVTAMASSLNDEFGTLTASGPRDCSSAETFQWAQGSTTVGDVYCEYASSNDASTYAWTYDDEYVFLEAVAPGKVAAGLKLWWHSLSRDQVTLR